MHVWFAVLYLWGLGVGFRVLGFGIGVQGIGDGWMDGWTDVWIWEGRWMHAGREGGRLVGS